jgi:hypothetical protein
MQLASQPEYPHRVFSELQRKLRRMTILVGMVGSDGIVLAADRRMVQPAQHENEFDDYEGILKIVNLKKHKVAYAGVGDYITRAVADDFKAKLDKNAFDLEDTEPLLIVARSAVEHEKKKVGPAFEEGLDRSLLIVFYGKFQPQLWRFRISPPNPTMVPIKTMTITGAFGNRARFFDRYFRQSIPINKLTFLASHIVLTAGQMDTAMIDGLDVALFNKAGFRLLDESQMAPLHERSGQLDALIRRHLGLPEQ